MFEVGLTVQKCAVSTVVILGLGCFFFFSLFLNIDPPIEIANSTVKRWENLHSAKPDEKLHHVDWFLQVTDIHISKFYGSNRGPDLENFCRSYIPVIKPKVVLVTGDLTDAKYADKQGSTQYEEEWKQYAAILKRSGVLNNTEWLDIRGNHDAFNVPSLEDRTNFYRKYSNKGRTDGESYTYTYESKGGTKISFIAIDACPNPGPRRPFNFFGIINQVELDRLNRSAQVAQENSDMIIWFGHYPSSTIGSPHPAVKQLISMGAVYMSGHLHTLGDLATKMYAKYKTGNLELELGDWKDNRKFRLFAIDHGLFSFIDEQHGTWPLVLITNPKNGQFNMPKFEPHNIMLRSSHIRILVFSPDPISRVDVKIDGENFGQATLSEGPLYALPWIPNNYAEGVHNIEVMVEDIAGRRNRVEQPFTLDYTEIVFTYLPRFILLSDHAANVKFIFAFAITGIILPMVLLRYMKFRIEITSNSRLCSLFIRFFQTWLRRISLLSSTDSVYYPLLFFHLYLATGPWFVGELLDGHIGVCFVYGLYTNGVLIPGTLTYFYGVLQIIQFHLPLMLYYGFCLDLTICEHKQLQADTSPSVITWLYRHGIFVFLLMFQVYMAVHGFYYAYGGVAFLLCPIRTWSLFLAIYIRSKCLSRGDSKRHFSIG